MVKIEPGVSPQADKALYKEMTARAEPKPPRLRNALLAFVTGGAVCVVGELITDFYEAVLHISHKQAGDPAVVTVIFVACLLTGLGVFDKYARTAGAGLAVPVTGFANALAASALEFRREGLVYGVGGRMFQLAGAVIVFGVVTAFGVGVVVALVNLVR